MDKNLIKAFRTIIHNCWQISTKRHGDRMQVQEIGALVVFGGTFPIETSSLLMIVIHVALFLL